MYPLNAVLVTLLSFFLRLLSNRLCQFFDRSCLFISFYQDMVTIGFYGFEMWSWGHNNLTKLSWIVFLAPTKVVTKK